MDEPVFINSRAEMEQILREEVLGYLGLAGESQPYVVPLNYAYTPGRILFHCALSGQKLETIRRNPRVCFTVGRQIGDNLTVTVGYTFLYLSDVIRPGDQIDRTVNFQTNDRPGVLFKETDFWLQGINVGLQWRF